MLVMPAFQQRKLFVYTAIKENIRSSFISIWYGRQFQLFLIICVGSSFEQN